jgi:ABC-type iron transport system FetAB permease component
MGLRLLAKLAERPEQPPLGWTNVSVALAFILFDVGLSTVFRLGLGVSLVVAAGRCMGQLTVVATLLHEVFENRNPRTVALIAYIQTLRLLSQLEYFELPTHDAPNFPYL